MMLERWTSGKVHRYASQAGNWWMRRGGNGIRKREQASAGKEAWLPVKKEIASAVASQCQIPTLQIPPALLYFRH